MKKNDFSQFQNALRREIFRDIVLCQVTIFRFAKNRESIKVFLWECLKGRIK